MKNAGSLNWPPFLRLLPREAPWEELPVVSGSLNPLLCFLDFFSLLLITLCRQVIKLHLSQCHWPTQSFNKESIYKELARTLWDVLKMN